MGPYHVTVNGTKFQMAFQAVDRSLRVSTEEGRVTVARRMSRGGEDGLRRREPQCVLSARERLDRMTYRRRRRRLPRHRTRAGGQGDPRVDRWRELLAAGRLLEGLRAAERANFDQVCRIATAKELLALADAGRFFGPSRRAVTALGALRQRFPGSADAGTAAFTLGRIVFEKEQAYGQAANWFETYSAGAAQRASDGRRLRPLDGSPAAGRRRRRRARQRRTVLAAIPRRTLRLGGARDSFEVRRLPACPLVSPGQVELLLCAGLRLRPGSALPAGAPAGTAGGAA